jgi:copper chaperone NosL
MAKTANWSEPGVDNWIDARQALFVVDSRQAGGMGAPEAIPFGERQAADAYAAANGGHVARLTEIPDSYVLAPVNVSSAAQIPGEAKP